MTTNQETIRETLSETYYLAKWSPELKRMTSKYWYDWFCTKKSLPSRAFTLLNRLRSISNSKKFDIDKTYVFFKNNASFRGFASALVDDFRICDIETDEVIYTVVPHTTLNGHGKTTEVWGRENNFEKPLLCGTWRDAKAFFAS